MHWNFVGRFTANLTRQHSSTRRNLGVYWLVAYAKCNRDSCESELGVCFPFSLLAIIPLHCQGLATRQLGVVISVNICINMTRFGIENAESLSLQFYACLCFKEFDYTMIALTVYLLCFCRINMKLESRIKSREPKDQKKGRKLRKKSSIDYLCIIDCTRMPQQIDYSR